MGGWLAVALRVWVAGAATDADLAVVVVVVEVCIVLMYFCVGFEVVVPVAVVWLWCGCSVVAVVVGFVVLCCLGCGWRLLRCCVVACGSCASALLAVQRAQAHLPVASEAGQLRGYAYTAVV